jgi:hypothetical protein
VSLFFSSRAAVLALALALAVLAGCATKATQPAQPPRPVASNRGDQPDNVFRSPATLPGDLKRVVVLPIACDPGAGDLASGCDALDPILHAELLKTKRFEVVAASPAVMQEHTGSATWTGTEALPPHLLDSLREIYGCDAVLFSELTVFRAYAPLAVGWRLKLVDVRTGNTLWAVDEVFDAGHPAVRTGARQYAQDRHAGADCASGEWLAENSPRQFGQYSAARVLATLPGR